MDNDLNSNVAEFTSFKINDPEEIRKSRERIADHHMTTGKDIVYAVFRLSGMEIDYDEIFSK